MLGPHLNILVISNGELSDLQIIKSDSIEGKYGWVKHDALNKLVSVKSFNDDNKIKVQKYFLSLPTKWYLVENCEKCYPQKEGIRCIDIKCEINKCQNYHQNNICPLREVPLYATDKTSVTPDLMFGFPRVREINEDDSKRNIVITNEALQYGHTVRNNSHYSYNISDEVFLEDNIAEVERWLKDVYYDIRRSNGLNIRSIDNILIIAPKHFSNSRFINIVNEILFLNSANILHFDFNNNNIDNFKVFYGDLVRNSNKIIFVDDAVITGSTFIRANDYVKQIRDDGYSHGYDCAIFLINRSSYYSSNNIKRKFASFDRLYSYANIHLPVLSGDGSACLLCQEREKVMQLYKDSLLIRFKYIFKDKIKDLIPRSVYSKKGLSGNVNENIITVEVHRLYEYFNNKKYYNYFKDENNIYLWVKFMISVTNTPFSIDYINKNKNNILHASNIDIVIKVMSIPPFSQYKPIRDKMFGWVIMILNERVENIKRKNYQGIDYNELRSLKFMIRRAGIIGSNYLISDRFIGFVIELYNSGCLNDIRNKAEKDKQNYQIDGYKLFDELRLTQQAIIDNIDDFSVYIVAQIKELIYQNESRCIVLQSRILKYMSDDNEYSPQVLQLFRMLFVESGVLIQRFWEFYILQKPRQDLFQLSTKRHYQYNSLCEYLKTAAEDLPEINYSFSKYINIKTYLHEDECVDNGHMALEHKTSTICDMLMELMFGPSHKSGDGAYLLINYNRDNSRDSIIENTFLAYNKGRFDEDVNNGWYEQDNYIIELVVGALNIRERYIITVDLLEKRYDEWHSIYSPSNSGSIKIEYLINIESIKYVLMMRLSIETPDDKHGQQIHPQGVIVFYSNENVFDVTKTRYLLLLRDAISAFIKKHHKTNEFRDWWEKSKQLEFINAISHDSDVYKNAFNSLCKNIPDDDLRLSVEIIGVLMINKLYIMKFVRDYSECKDLDVAMERNKVIKRKFKISEVKEKISKYADIIFSFEHDEHNIIPKDCYEVRVDSHSKDDIEVYSVFFNDIVFELFFNIRKVYSDYLGDYLNSKNKIEVNINITDDEIVFSNNKAGLIYVSDFNVCNLANRIRDRGRVKGLNLINSLSEILFNKKINIVYRDDKFITSIPLQ